MTRNIIKKTGFNTFEVRILKSLLSKTRVFKAIFCIALASITASQAMAMNHGKTTNNTNICNETNNQRKLNGSIENDQMRFELYNDCTAKLFIKKEQKIVEFKNIFSTNYDNKKNLLLIKHNDGSEGKIDIETGKEIKQLFENDQIQFKLYDDCTAKVFIKTIQEINELENVLSFYLYNQKKLLSIKLNNGKQAAISTETGEEIKNLFDNDQIRFELYYDCKAKVFRKESQESVKLNNIFRVDCSDKGKFLSIKFHNEDELVINTKTGKEVGRLFKDVAFFKFSHNDKLLFVAYNDALPELINVENGETISLKNKETVNKKLFSNIYNCKFSHNDKFLIVKYNNSTAKLIDLENKKIMNSDFINSNNDLVNVNWYKFNHYDNFLLVKYLAKNNEQAAKLFDLKNKKISSYENVDCCKFIENGTSLCLRYANETVEKINLVTWKSSLTLKDETIYRPSQNLPFSNALPFWHNLPLPDNGDYSLMKDYSPTDENCMTDDDTKRENQMTDDNDNDTKENQCM